MGKKKGQGGEKAALGWSAALLRIMVGGVIGAAVCGAGLLVCALLISGGAVGEGSMGGAVLACALAGGFGGGIAAVRGAGERRLVVGLSAGTAQFLILMTAGMLLYEDASFEHGGVGLLLMCCCGGALAGVAGRRGGRRRRR